nr:MAG TPA: major tail protein [Caudoviricetes sp.]
MAMLVGFEQAQIGIYNSFNDEHIDPSKIFTVDSKSGGTLGANIQNLNYSPTTVYASDIAYRISGKGHGAITVAFTAEDIPIDIIYQICGATKDNDGGYRITKDTIAPYCSLLLISHDSEQPNPKHVYLAVLKGQFGFPERNPQTNNANETDATDSLTFTAIDRLNGDTYKEFYESDADFDANKMMDFVFPGANAAVTPTGVSLDQTAGSVEAGKTLQINGTVYPDDATDKTIDWSSDDTHTATVDNTGKVTGVAAGTTLIHAKAHADHYKEAIYSLTVTAAPTQG